MRSIRAAMPIRADLAAEALRGKVDAPRYAAGERAQVIAPPCPLRGVPDAHASWTTEALFGERCRPSTTKANGWAWVQLERDGYVGYVPADALSSGAVDADPPGDGARHVCLSRARLQIAAAHAPQHECAVCGREDGGDRFCQAGGGGFVVARHLPSWPPGAPISSTSPSASSACPTCGAARRASASTARGWCRSRMHAAGSRCPRDSDMQQAELGTIPGHRSLEGLERGDLVFWPGHVGIMIDAVMLLHANAHHMAVVSEPFRRPLSAFARPVLN